MAQRTRVPILLLTGFLGSGKTSLLSNWLRSPEFSGAMVIVNELGEVGLDDRLVQFSSDGAVMLENGCACCEAAEDLSATLERLFWQRLHRDIPRFEWVLIETTGMADPAPIMASLATHELVGERYRLAGVVTVFDARRGPEQISQHPECLSQMNRADVLVISKSDLATAQEMKAAQDTVREINPQAQVFISAQGDLPATAIVAALAAPRQQQSVDEQEIAAIHSPDVTTAFAPLPAVMAWTDIDQALNVIFKRYGKRILRLKGLARVGDAGQIEVIQAAHGEAVDRKPFDAGPQASPLRTGLTFIAQFAPAELVARDFLSLLPQQAASAATVFPRQARG